MDVSYRKVFNFSSSLLFSFKKKVLALSTAAQGLHESQKDVNSNTNCGHQIAVIVATRSLCASADASGWRAQFC
jgi:hypothetical protein